MWYKHHSNILRFKERHCAITDHHTREAIATRAIRQCHIASDINVTNGLAKLLPNPVFFSLIKPFLFRIPNGARLPRKIETEAGKVATSDPRGG